MDCNDAIDHFNDASHDFSGNLGGYIDHDPHVSMGDVIGSGMDTASGYVIVDMACDGHDSGDSHGGHDAGTQTDSGGDSH